MPGTLREIRQPPLLTPPPTESLEWMDVTGEDCKAAVKGFRFFREAGNVRAVLHLHAYMKVVGYHTSVSLVEKRAFQSFLADARKKGLGHDILDVRWALKLLGLPHSTADGDDAAVGRQLQFSRQDREPTLIAEILHRQKVLGETVTSIPADREIFMEGLDDKRSHKMGQGAATIYLGAKAAGSPLSIAPEDRTLMREHLEFYRREVCFGEEGDPVGIWHMHYLLRELFDSHMGDETQPIPPLKRFKR